MHPLWKVENFTSKFKYQGDIWRIMHDGDTYNTVMVCNERTKHITTFNLDTLVEPIGVDMG